MKPAVITTSLPEKYIQLLNEYSRRLKRPKNKIMEEALERHFELLKRAEYIAGFRRVKGDPEMKTLAEEGLAEYIKLFEE